MGGQSPAHSTPFLFCPPISVCDAPPSHSCRRRHRYRRRLAMGIDAERPAFIRNFRELLEPARQWAHQEDLHADNAAFRKKLGLARIGINYEILPPGYRTSLPH